MFTTLGFSALPARFSEKLDETRVFSHTAYNFPALLNVCEKLATQAVEKEGGFVCEENGESFFYIPKTEFRTSALTSCAAPTDKPVEGPEAMFSEEELAKLKFRTYNDDAALDKFFFGFRTSHMGPDMSPGYRDEYRGRKNVFMTHPENREVGAVLSGKTTAARNSGLRFVVSHHLSGDQIGDYELIVRIDGKEALRTVVSKDSVAADGWQEIEVPF